MNRVKIVSAGKTGTPELIPLAEVLVGDGSRRLADLGEFTVHQHRDAPRPLVCEVILLQSAYKKVVDHLSHDTTREHGGFLLGYECAMDDAKTPAVVIVDAVAAKFTQGSPVQLIFTTNTWRDLDDEISERYGDGDRVPQRVGWYHSHPNIRIFLSHYDLDVCRTYERRQYPMALVVDPIKDRGGFFIGTAKGYDPAAPQGFYEAHDLAKESVVTWNNISGAAVRVSVPPVEEILRSSETPDAKSITIYHVTPQQRRAALIRQIVLSLTVVMMMVATIGYSLLLQQRQQVQIDKIETEIATLRAEKNAWEITILPVDRDLKPSEQVEFKAETKNVEGAIAWTIDPKGAGTISHSGVYKAPANVTGLERVTVRAASVTDASKFASVQVRLQPPAEPAVSISLSQQMVQLGPSKSQRFQVQITGSWKARKAGVRWTIDPPDMGKISKDGVYVSPPVIAENSSVKVSAISVADPSQSAQAVVKLVGPAAVVAGQGSNSTGSGGEAVGDGKAAGTQSPVTPPAINTPTVKPPVFPTAVVAPPGPTLEVTSDKTIVSEGESARFSAASGLASVADVTWSLEPGGAGTISVDGQYMAPAEIPSEVVVTITAKSKDAAKTGKKVITVKPRAKPASNPMP